VSSGALLDELGALIETDRTAIDEALRGIADEITQDAPARIADPIRYALAAGGKRLRPLLVLAAYRAASGETPTTAVLRLACALELIHTYSLVHDDLPCMDNDDFRRGRPAVHRVFGTAAATAAGAALIPAAFRILNRAVVELGLGDARLDFAMELARAAGGGGMVGGQWLDLAAEGSTVGIEELEDIHARKTGALFSCALRLGGMAGRANRGTLDALGSAGAALGLAFQVTDDLLDAAGHREALGKTAGRDRVLEKATFPSLLGVEQARNRASRAANAAIAALTAARLEDDILFALLRFAAERDR
jgi:geranylgeranyl diphosphate synthase type II